MLKATGIDWDTNGDDGMWCKLPHEVDIPEGLDKYDIAGYLTSKYHYFAISYDLEEELDALFLYGTDTEYSDREASETMTVNQLIDKLTQLRDENQLGDCPVFIMNDELYNTGRVNEQTIKVGKYTCYL